MRKFKTESKKLLDLMVNSIYTDKDIFLRELISNASDSLDKLYVQALGAGDASISRNDLKIDIALDKDARTITVTDNGIGMTKDELEKNLGTIAHSGSLDFKSGDADKLDDVDIIGQFGVGFYSSFMVADKVEVITRAYGSDEACTWESDGIEGYTIGTGEREERGTDIILHIRPQSDEHDYDKYLNTYTIKHLVKHYSDYIRYPIGMDIEHSRALPKPDDAPDDYKTEYEHYIEHETLNSMVPIWTKKKSNVTDEEYNEFYKARFNDREDPLRIISMHAEGTLSYDVLLFIPKEPAPDLYSKDFKKGLALYSNNVLIMEKCEDLLPDCFGFVRGIVDSPDLSLNISRELLQHDRQLRAIAKKIEKKIAAELKGLCDDERETYEEFFTKFGRTFKYAIYASYGTQKELLEDLLLFHSAKDSAYVSLAEYTEAMPEEQTELYYATGGKEARLAQSPNVKAVLAKDFDVLLCGEDIDEFCLMSMGTYDDKELRNVEDQKLDLASDEEKEETSKVKEEHGELFSEMKAALGDQVSDVVPSTRLEDAACCITAAGSVSLGMAKYFEQLPEGMERPKAELVLEINPKHAVFTALKDAMEADDKEKVATLAKVLYGQARLAEGLQLEDPAAYNEAVLEMIL